MDSPPPSSLRLGSQALQVLAHPLRSRILSRLRTHGPATATALAAALETNTGATSYHLRKLAEVELVQETHDGRGKERWWKASTEMHGWGAKDVAGDPDGKAASDWLARHYFQQFEKRYADWLDGRSSWSLDWQEAADGSDRVLMLSPDQLTAMSAEVMAVLDRYREPESVAAADVQQVHLYLHAFPVADG